jgi:hypothetical protein
LILEVLEDRLTPSSALWVGGGVGGKWEDPANWKWDNQALQGKDYPGDNVTRTNDIVTFDSSTNPCKLGVNLAGTIEALNLTKNVGAGVVELNGDVAVDNGLGLYMASGTLQIDTGHTLTLNDLGGNLLHTWAGGIITGGGDLDVRGHLYVTSSASSIACNINILLDQTTGRGGILEVDNNGNMVLAGTNNNIVVDTGGTLSLDKDVTAGNGDTMGGITGGNGHTITVKGTFVRGTADHVVGGQVLVNVPVHMTAGNMYLYSNNTMGGVTDGIHFAGASQVGPDSVLLDTGAPSIYQDAGTNLIADNPITLDSKGSLYEPTLNGNGPATTLEGSLTISSGTLATVETGGVKGNLTITGNLFLDTGAILTLQCGKGVPDVINVGGTATLGGALQLGGVQPPVKNVPFTVITAPGGIIGDFANFANIPWLGDPSVKITGQRVANISYQVTRTA